MASFSLTNVSYSFACFQFSFRKSSHTKPQLTIHKTAANHMKKLLAIVILLISNHCFSQITSKTKQVTDTLCISKNKNYNILITTISKEEYQKAKTIKTAAPILDKTTIPPQVNLTKDCYTVTTPTKTVKNCLKEDEQFISLSYLGTLKKLNTCIIYENWFESSRSNVLINLNDGTTSYISGNELIFSPNLKFIYSYAFDEIDFSGISFHQMIDNKAQPILITDYNTEEKYKFNFSNFGKAFWISNTSLYAVNNEAYYKFTIQDK